MMHEKNQRQNLEVAMLMHTHNIEVKSAVDFSYYNHSMTGTVPHFADYVNKKGTRIKKSCLLKNLFI